MAVLKCKMCGAQLIINEGQQLAECEYCGSVQTVPKLDDELKLKMFERANDLRARCEFDQAATLFQSIIMQFPDEAEAYWGLVLCKYGIEYVDDTKTTAKIPTCHRTQPKSILDDEDYLTACEYAGVTKWVYEKEATEIDRIQKKILDIVRTEKPYDIFICYKETDDTTKTRTEDSSTAQDIYTELISKGYRVFYSRISLRDKAGSEYEPYIYAALSSAKVMLVLGSKAEYFTATWLKNEWSRYLNMLQNGNKTIIPCFEKIAANELPKELKRFEALDMSSKLFFTDLFKNIVRLVPKSSQKTAPVTVKEVKKEPVQKNSVSSPIFKEERTTPPPPTNLSYKITENKKHHENQNALKFFKMQGIDDIDEQQLAEYKKDELKEKIRDIIMRALFSSPVLFILYYFFTEFF